MSSLSDIQTVTEEFQKQYGQRGLSDGVIKRFQSIILDYYTANQRILPWRQTENPYFILVSELMLQQTQVERVIPKYEQFLLVFPTIQDLAQAPVAKVLEHWQGLGYNRRALALQRAAQQISEKYAGKMPEQKEELIALPGIGPYTASAVRTFAFDLPDTFIETNIRRLFIHFFFPEEIAVDDKQLFPLIEATLPKAHFRHWYYALMDYGSMLGKAFPNPNRRSRHYTKQSAFQGSNRQVRGAILKILLERGRLSLNEIGTTLQFEKERVMAAFLGLKEEGFIEGDEDEIRLSGH